MRGSVVARWWGEESGDSDRRKESPGRRRVRALSHRDLLAEMRREDLWAWGEFAARFRPLLEEYATQTGIPKWRWNECIENVLDDEAMHLTKDGAVVPDRLEAYLIQAVRHRYLSIKRAEQRRERRELDALESGTDDAAGEYSGGGVLRLLCSEYALREADRDRTDTIALSPGLLRLTSEILSRIRPEERQLLEWVGQRATHGQIAKWLDIGYDAATKRIWRLCGRVRAFVAQIVASFPPEDRREVERYLRRALSRHARKPPRSKEPIHEDAAGSLGTEESES